MNLSYIQWDPDPVFWRLPLFGHPIVWYGVLFALGFLIGYYITRWQVARLMRDHMSEPETGFKAAAGKYTDRLLWLSILGTVIGARLGHVFFYRWPYFKDHLFEIVEVWNGGLASHGAAVGITVALLVNWLWTRKKYPCITFFRLFDLIGITTAFIGVMIRVGNFVNQELVGTETTVPWAVVFGHPAGGFPPVPRHPVQLYEAFSYLAIFGLLIWLSRRRSVRDRGGILGGLFLVLVFGARFVLESLKTHQSALLSQESLLSMGQILSIPLVLLGLGLIAHAWYWGRRRNVGA